MTITKERPRELVDRSPKDVLERPQLRKPEVQKPRGRRWYPWIASLVVVGVAATALVLYLVGGRDSTPTYETAFNTELAAMMTVTPDLVGPVDTSGAFYDPIAGTVVFPNGHHEPYVGEPALPMGRGAYSYRAYHPHAC